MSDRGLESGETMVTHGEVILRDGLAKFLGLQPRECQCFPARRDLFLPAMQRVHIYPKWVIVFLRYYSRGDRLLT